MEVEGLLLNCMSHDGTYPKALNSKNAKQTKE